MSKNLKRKKSEEDTSRPVKQIKGKEAKKVEAASSSDTDDYRDGISDSGDENALTPPASPSLTRGFNSCLP